LREQEEEEEETGILDEGRWEVLDLRRGREVGCCCSTGPRQANGKEKQRRGKDQLKSEKKGREEEERGRRRGGELRFNFLPSFSR